MVLRSEQSFKILKIHGYIMALWELKQVIMPPGSEGNAGIRQVHASEMTVMSRPKS